jgi:putative protease
MAEQIHPLILAPAGGRGQFLAALAAGADAVYAGLKHFSARMQADNFSSAELAALTETAHERGSQVFVAMNTLVKPGDPRQAGRLLDRLGREVRPDGVIVQDPAMIELARQVGYEGEVHLSTLANVSFPSGMAWAREKLGADRVVLPRELDIDEVKACAAACPPGLSLEIFVHGALCYNVSGRCYWSSFLGGKSGLRGRCVQPCRRIYSAGGRKARFFSCRDLSLDVLTSTLLPIPEISAWKIEGRKKGPHYVYYTTYAYKLLRDERGSTQAKKEAESLLSRALGRPGTHYAFLPQRSYDPTSPGKDAGSGLMVGRVSHTPAGDAYFKPGRPLIKGDVLRVGFEDEPWHRTIRLGKAVPKNGRMDLKRKGKRPPSGTPVIMLDRREPELNRILADMEREIGAKPAKKIGASNFEPRAPKSLEIEPAAKAGIMHLRRRPFKGRQQGQSALWLSGPNLGELSRTVVPRFWWWLPPVVWPKDEERMVGLVSRAVKFGARNFVLNQPWQAAFFAAYPKARLWAGPYCNIANAQALKLLDEHGFSGAFVSPELSGEEMSALPKQSPLPLGAVTRGLWPLGVSRAPREHVKDLRPLESPMGEISFVRAFDGNTWLFPNWPLDLSEEEQALSAAGYCIFVHIQEPFPRSVPKADRTTKFNWDLQLM